MSIENDVFPNFIKLAKVSLIFNRNNDLDKENYSDVCGLSHLSKVFERIIYDQLNNFSKDKASNLLTDFKKDHSTHVIT